MKKRKLELKDMVGYLPYGMLFQEQKDHTIMRMDNIETRNNYKIWATQKYIRGVVYRDWETSRKEIGRAHV